MSIEAPPVIIAKNLLVWLSQLSAASPQPVQTLDAIPDRELDLLAERGFTVLWLIGVWERSPASAALKVQSGFLNQTASPYAIRSYRIDRALGGRLALEQLKRRCRLRGIRLAADFVPNHDAMDSRWMREHPDWFISSPEPPFSNYRYTGLNLSIDPDQELYIDDGYADQSDAAVTFKRIDKQGNTSYVYHGNDGTDLPWNDTAQLDLSIPEVRQGIINRLMHVASIFPVVRVDAAMVTAKHQFRRLWYPQDGDTGSVPSRTPDIDPSFDDRFADDFWPEAVSRLEKERPGTLLIGEVMWTMEGYFLDEMGFDTVYDNEDMPAVVRGETRVFCDHLTSMADSDPKKMERFVRFLQNPDAAAVADTIGKGSRYFGLCSLIATLPGIPLFGHGQIEGSLMRYPMSASQHDLTDTPDLEVILGHEERIFPVLRKRALFSRSDGFRVLQFTADTEDHQVICFENTSESPVVVAFNHSDHPVSGAIVGALSEETQGEGFVLCRNVQNENRRILSLSEIRSSGIPVELGPYESATFIGFDHLLEDRSGLVSSVSRRANTADVKRAAESSVPILRSIGAAVFESSDFRRGVFRSDHNQYSTHALRVALEYGYALLDSLAADLCDISGETAASPQFDHRLVETLGRLQMFLSLDGRGSTGPAAYFRRIYGLLPYAPSVLAGLIVVTLMFKRAQMLDLNAHVLMDGETTRPLAAYVRSLHGDEAASVISITAPLLETHGDIAEVFKDRSAMAYLKINSYDNRLWVDKDRLGDLLWWIYTMTLCSSLAHTTVRETYNILKGPYERITAIQKTAETLNYDYDGILSFVDNPGDGHTSPGAEGPG